MTMRRALLAALLAAVLHAQPAAATEPAATPPVGDTGPVDWHDPAPAKRIGHAPSFAHRVYPAATQAARDWAWRKLGASEFACLDRLWHFESGWRVAAGSPSRSFGIPQAFPGSRMASAGADWRTNPMTQVRWGLGYIHARYGTSCRAWAFWQSARWY